MYPFFYPFVQRPSFPPLVELNEPLAVKTCRCAQSTVDDGIWVYIDKNWTETVVDFFSEPE